MDLSIVEEALKYDISERIIMVEDIWDSIADVPNDLPVTNEQKEELDKRLIAYHVNPKAGSYWEAVKGRMLDK